MAIYCRVVSVVLRTLCPKYGLRVVIGHSEMVASVGNTNISFGPQRTNQHNSRNTFDRIHDSPSYQLYINSSLDFVRCAILCSAFDIVQSMAWISCKSCVMHSNSINAPIYGADRTAGIRYRIRGNAQSKNPDEPIDEDPKCNQYMLYAHSISRIGHRRELMRDCREPRNVALQHHMRISCV